MERRLAAWSVSGEAKCLVLRAFSAENATGNIIGRRSFGLFLEVLADGKNSLREPPCGSAPQRSQGSEAPRPPRRALRAFGDGFLVVVRSAHQPRITLIQRRAAVFQLDDVVNDHAALDTATTWHLTSSTCFASHTVAQRDPSGRRVERVCDLRRQGRRAQIRKADAWLQRSQSHDRVAPNKAIE